MDVPILKVWVDLLMREAWPLFDRMHSFDTDRVNVREVLLVWPVLVSLQECVTLRRDGLYQSQLREIVHTCIYEGRLMLCDWMLVVAYS